MRETIIHQCPPHPVKRKGTKRIDCPFYDQCQTYATERMWDYWSCGPCLNQALMPAHKMLHLLSNMMSHDLTAMHSSEETIKRTKKQSSWLIC